MFKDVQNMLSVYDKLTNKLTLVFGIALHRSHEQLKSNIPKSI